MGMRILFVSPYVPSLIRVRSYNWIKHLIAQGHQVTLLALVSGPDDEAALPEMQKVCERVLIARMPRWRPIWNCLRALPTSEPLQHAYSRLPAMNRLIGRALAETKFDVAHIEHLRGACFSPALRGVPVVYDAVDSISLLFERTAQTSPQLSSRLMARLDLKRTEKFEAKILGRFIRTLISSPVDAEHIFQLAGPQTDRERLKVLPNAVDLNYFYPNGHNQSANTLIFSGKMSYHANVAAALYLGQEILPRVWNQRPQVQLWIVGKDPAPSIQALAKDQRITVTGYVPDLRPFLWEAELSVSPIRYGAGTQFKVLEAMASGTPVITSSLACQGLPLKPGHQALIADTPAEFARQILTLLDSPERQAALAREGRRYVEKYHSWHTQASRLATIYQEAIKEYGPHARK